MFHKQDNLNHTNDHELFGTPVPKRKVVSRHKGEKVVHHRTQLKNVRYFRQVGMGFKTPALAIQGQYVDKKCPFTGDVSIRGRIFKSLVISTKMNRTIIVRRDYLHYIRKYKRYEKRHRNIAAHCSPAFRRIKVGDIATVGQCRPLSKTVRFNVLKVQPNIISGSVKKQFLLF